MTINHIFSKPLFQNHDSVPDSNSPAPLTKKNITWLQFSLHSIEINAKHITYIGPQTEGFET